MTISQDFSGIKMTIFKKETGTQGVPFKYLLNEKNTEWKKKIRAIFNANCDTCLSTVLSSKWQSIFQGIFLFTCTSCFYFYILFWFGPFLKSLMNMLQYCSVLRFGILAMMYVGS